MEKEQKITLLRAAIMTPYLNDDRIFNFIQKIAKAMEKKLNEIIQ